MRALQTSVQLGLGAAVARGGASRKGCTRLRGRSIEDRASVHGTVGLLVVIGELRIAGDSSRRAVENEVRPQTHADVFRARTPPSAVNVLMCGILVDW